MQITGQITAQATAQPIFWVQCEVKQDWRRLQQCTDQGAAVLALERLVAQGRYGALRLLKVDRNARHEPVDYQVLVGYQSGERLSEADATETTRELRAAARRRRMMNALPQTAALAVTFVASVGLGVWVATL
jgi:hypothetical protein